MAPENRWTEAAERDLIMSLLINDGDTDNLRIKPNWQKVHDRMLTWGYNFTKDAINQRWSKIILKEFRGRRADTMMNAVPPAPTPRKRSRPMAKTPTSSAKKRGSRGQLTGPVDDRSSSGGEESPTPKRIKTEPTDSDVHKEEDHDNKDVKDHTVHKQEDIKEEDHHAEAEVGSEQVPAIKARARSVTLVPN